MAENIRQQHKRINTYEARTNFLDQKEYTRRLLYTIGSWSDPA
jgi:hypothetical protein